VRILDYAACGVDALHMHLGDCRISTALMVGFSVLAHTACTVEATPPMTSTQLSFGQVTRLTIRPEQGDSVQAMCVIPPDAVALEWHVRGAPVELECGAQPFEAIRSAHEAAAGTLTELGTTVLRIDRWSEPPLIAGVWHAAWSVHGWSLPRSPDGVLTSVSFDIEPRLLLPPPPVALAYGTPVNGTVQASAGHTWRAVITVPVDAEVLRVDILEAEQDLDLLAYPGRELRGLDAQVRMRSRPYGREHLVVTKPAAGEWTIEVVDPLALPMDTEFRVLATAADTPPPLSLEPLTHPTRLGSQTPWLASVVEVCTPDGTGSAVGIHPSGVYLTNAHVVSRMGGGVATDIVLCVTHELGTAPRETYQAEVLEYDGAMDLALLRISGDRHGRPLPVDWRVPSVELRETALPELSSELYIVGYPGVGTQRSRPTLTLTRGIVAGFERASNGGWTIKSDAEITSGHSGGAAFTSAGLFIGTPTSRVEDGASQLGWIHTPSMLTPAMRARLAALK
jgi:S1-C subfamily serine protease